MFTAEQVNRLLETLCADIPEKADNFRRTIEAMRLEDCDATEMYKTLLGSALDWVSYGN